MAYGDPYIVTVYRSKLPDPPAGWNYTGLSRDPIRSDFTVLVLLFGSYAYTALDQVDNPPHPAMKIIGWDAQRNIVKDMNKEGARYLSDITFDRARQTVKFSGQAGHFVSATLDELIVHPIVAHLPSSSGPLLPYPLAYGNADPNKFPVVKCGIYTFWPVTYKDGRDTICVVVANQDNVIQGLIDCPGTQLVQNIEINNFDRKILLRGWDGSEASFDYETAMASFYYDYTVTKDDFQFLAKYFHVPLSSDDAMALEKAMPHVSSALSNPLVGSSWTKWWRDSDQVVVGPFLGGFIGTLGGFLIGGPTGIDPAFITSSEATMKIGPAVDSSWDMSDYSLSNLERECSAIDYGFNRFPSGPFSNGHTLQWIFTLPFLRYGNTSLLYCAAVARYSATSPLQAYIPAQQRIGSFPRNPSYTPITLKSGVQVTKYTFVIISTLVSEHYYYQMRIIHEDFESNKWPTTKRITHAQVSSGFNLWALAGSHPGIIYSGGSLFVDVTNQKILGIDTRPANYFRPLGDEEQATSKAAVDFLSRLGYPTSHILENVDVLGYFQENLIAN